MSIIVLLIGYFALVKSACDNACSGHGVCGIHSKCECFDNWGIGLSHDSGDCSQRTCPYEFAWVDKPDKIGGRHNYAECAAKGICNRDSGECECFPGYEGKGCQRTTCPNDCSGHGKCVYIEDMGYQVVPQDYGPGYFYPQSPKTFDYYYWDMKKTRGCVCDPEYADVDCSKRMCPYGNDVMDIRNNLDAPAKYQVQQIDFVPDSQRTATLDGLSFALTFKSKLNETFTTVPIVFSSSNYTNNTFHEFALDTRMALLNLPNKVIDMVNVAGNYTGTEAHLTITFVGENVQGPQNLITVKSYLCGDGCTPKLTGMDLLAKNENITEIQVSDFNSYECGRRGKCDYTTGICACFEGYTGNSCNTITALV